jgi:hypothetical protein
MLRDFQNSPDIPRPNLLQQQIPVVGSAWQAVGDLQDRNYVSAAINAGSALAEATPVGAAVRGARVLKLGGELLNVAPKATEIVYKMKKAGLVAPGMDVHHAIRLMGKPRNLPDVRNHPLLLKPLPKQIHQRIHHRSGDLARFNPAERVWHGTTAGMKTVPLGLLGYTVSSVENAQRASPGRTKATSAPARQAPRRP